MTLPGFKAKNEEDGSWGYDYRDIVQMLEKAILKHKKSKKVILITHDWGSSYGFSLQKKCPNLIQKMVAVDIGDEMPTDLGFKIFSTSYQLLMVLCFLMGEPSGRLILKLAYRR